MSKRQHEDSGGTQQQLTQNPLVLTTGSRGPREARELCLLRVRPTVCGGMGHGPATLLPRPWKTMTHQQKQENVAQNFRGGKRKHDSGNPEAPDGAQGRNIMGGSRQKVTLQQ